jgi:hypothetical protein
MTLTIARKREKFAVLASDGRWSNGPNDASKIACHPSLPKACTASGLLALPLAASDQFRKKYSFPDAMPVPVTMYIRDVLEGITSFGDMTTEKIAELCAGKLAPFVDDMHFVACHVAIVKNEKANVGFMVVGLRSAWPPNPVDHGTWGWWPDGVRQGCGLNLMTELFDAEFAQADTSPPQNPDELAAIMRTMVSEAIARDANRSAVPNIGGTAHLAKVTRDGAFYV